ncbi:hypothetical protein IFO70_30340 [Phormidium tenue FACHB-886]|nr:hypothetical protein [Phormidium tenue FACHB-886]
MAKITVSEVALSHTLVELHPHEQSLVVGGAGVDFNFGFKFNITSVSTTVDITERMQVLVEGSNNTLIIPSAAPTAPTPIA